MSKVFSYIRFSSAKQSAGDSYARQVKAAKAFCDEYGLEMADPKEYLFFDAGRSAYKGKHLDDTGELARFLGYVEDGSVPSGSYLVVESLDRLSREKVRDALPRFLDLLAKGIRVYTSIDKRLYTQDYNEIDLIISIISMSRAHEESAIKGKRVSSAWRAKHQQARDTGKPMGKLRPLWLDLAPEGYVANLEKVAVVRRIFDQSTQGYGTRVIASDLNKEGIPPFSSGRRNLSGLWGMSGIRNILESRATLGEFQPHIFVDGKRVASGEPVKNYFPAAVTEEEFYLAQAAKSSRRQHKFTKTTANFNVLAGVIHCQSCGSAMHYNGKNNKRKYFECSRRLQGVCNAGIVGADRAETIFKEILAKVDSLSLVRDSSGRLQKDLSVIDGRLEELENKQNEAESTHSEYPSRVTARLLQELETEIENITNQKEELIEKLAADKIINRHDFFEKLDLVTYEGRAAANNLMKRLGIYIYVKKLGRLNEMYSVTSNKAIPAPFSEESKNLMFYLTHNKDHIRFTAFQDQYVDLQEIQGELTPMQALMEKTESWDDLPPDVLDRLKAHNEAKHGKLK